MRAQFSLSDIEHIKRQLAALLPAVKSSHRVEAMARGLGWNTNAALRAELALSETDRVVDDHAFTEYLDHHGFPGTFGSLGEAVVRCKFSAERDAIATVMEQQPTLTRFGLELPDSPKKMTREERAAALKNRREDMLRPWAVDEFMKACHFLSQFGQRLTINTRSSSYGLKHEAERFHSELAGPVYSYDPYVSNGMLIAAAVHLGFKLKQVGPNAYFNITTKPGHRVPAVPLPRGVRIAAWRNLMIAAINAGLEQKLFTLAPDDNRWTGNGQTYSFTFAGFPAIAHVGVGGYGELKFHAAVNPTKDAAAWIEVSDADFLAGEAFATAWLERRKGAWLQTSARPQCAFRRHILPILAQTDVKPNGYLPEGMFMM